MSFVKRLSSALLKTSDKMTLGLAELAGKRRLDADFLQELEDLLLMADLGVETAAFLVSQIQKQRFNKEITLDEVKTLLATEIEQILQKVVSPLKISAVQPHVLLMVGVNGSGKTTTIAKLGQIFKAQGFNGMFAAGDTFRAAAVEQLQTWGNRLDIPVISKDAGADPAALAYEAIEKAKSQKKDFLLIDTAGRLHNRIDLMAELQKVVRVIHKLDEDAPHNCVLVLDATIGQNALTQVKAYQEMVNVSGLIITKLDGSAKGGVVVGLAHTLGLPIHAVGVGEGADDLQPFDPAVFAQSLVGITTA
ncbi:MAG: signal recognition particle-docking protein FtsY [Alphaproteobacteria bacterium]